MLRSSKLDDTDFDYVDLQDDDFKDMPTETPQSYAGAALSTLAYMISVPIKSGLVYTVTTIGGAFAVVTVAPRAVPYVVSYIVPSAAAPGVTASVTPIVVGAITFKVGSMICASGAETAWDLTVGSAITYMFGSTKPGPKMIEMSHNHGHHPEHHNNHNRRPLLKNE
jgi:hypothetical protein